jgi:hypothetical protein
MTPSSLDEERKGRGFSSDLEVNFLVLTGTTACRHQTPRERGDMTFARAGRRAIEASLRHGARAPAPPYPGGARLTANTSRPLDAVYNHHPRAFTSVPSPNAPVNATTLAAVGR